MQSRGSRVGSGVSVRVLALCHRAHPERLRGQHTTASALIDDLSVASAVPWDPGCINGPGAGDQEPRTGGFVVFCPDDTSREPLDEFVRCKLFPPVSDGQGLTVRYYQRAGTPPRL